MSPPPRMGPLRLALAIVLSATAMEPGLVAVGVSGVSAQQLPRARVSADTTLITVGDRVTFDVLIEHAPDATVHWPDSLVLAPFEVLDAGYLAPTRRGELAVSGLRLVLTAFELGDLVVPGFDLEVVGADSTVASVTTDAYAISVASVGLDEGQEIRDIRGPLAIPRSLVLLTPWLLLSLALLGSAWWWWRRRSEGEAEKPFRHVDIPRAPHVAALEALDRLEGAGLLERGEIKAYHVELSSIIRTYVEARYDVFALEMTSAEVLGSLSRIGIEGEVLSDFGTFFEQCDLVKFAKLRPGPESSAAMLDLARHIVEQTRPRFESTPSVAEAEATVGEDGLDVDPTGSGSAGVDTSDEPEAAAVAHTGSERGAPPDEEGR